MSPTASSSDSAPSIDGGRRRAVQLRDAVAVVGDFPVLAGADLEVDVGQIVVLHGPNGAGKTSLLRLCAGLLPLTRGAATVLGHDLTADRESVRRRVGLLGHRNGLYQALTVAENVKFWGATVAATSDEVEGALARMGVAGRLRNVPVSRLSAGQKRRTALACLIARRAELWLLDEPHAGLDAAGRDELDATLRQAVAAGVTVIAASHELERAGALADRVVSVVGGQIAGSQVVDPAHNGSPRDQSGPAQTATDQNVPDQTATDQTGASQRVDRS